MPKFLIATVMLCVFPFGATAAPIIFSSATATFQQTQGGYWPASEMIDGITNGQNGWADYQFSGSGLQTQSETALFTLGNPLSGAAADINFTLYMNYGNYHLLGDFSLGYTTSANPTLASAQTPFVITNASSLNGTTFTSSAVGQLLAGGPLPQTDVYSITTSSAAPITGIYLNVINDPTNGLPQGGPGRQPNGNFALNEFTASTTSAVPEPSVWAMMLAGFVAIAAISRVDIRSKRRAFEGQAK